MASEIDTLKEQLKTAEETIKGKDQLLNKVYGDRAVLAQALVLKMMESGHLGGVRSVGDVEPEWPVLAVRVKNDDPESEIAFHINGEDIVTEDIRQFDYPYHWVMREQYDEATTEDEKGGIMREDTKRVRNVLEDLVRDLVEKESKKRARKSRRKNTE